MAMKEDRLLRCGTNEPWGFGIMSSALGLLEVHLGFKTSDEAKESSAERVINLHYKLLANNEPPASALGSKQAAGTKGAEQLERYKVRQPA